MSGPVFSDTAETRGRFCHFFADPPACRDTPKTRRISARDKRSDHGSDPCRRLNGGSSQTDGDVRIRGVLAEERTNGLRQRGSRCGKRCSPFLPFLCTGQSAGLLLINVQRYDSSAPEPASPSPPSAVPEKTGPIPKETDFTGG